MRHKLAPGKLSRPTQHRLLMLKGATMDLLKYESIKTTEAKAKEIKKMTEKAITTAKRSGMNNKRLVGKIISDKSVLDKLFKEIAPRYESRSGGYTRITKSAKRKGDGASLAIIELVS